MMPRRRATKAGRVKRIKRVRGKSAAKSRTVRGRTGARPRTTARGRASAPVRRAHPRREVLPGPQPDSGVGPGRAGATGGNPLLKAAGRFHGHIGPFLALGMKMGLLANEVIGRDPFGVEADVTTEVRPPRGCLIDGLQYATGCTMGKGNIRLNPHPTWIRASFRRGGRVITVAVKDDLVARIESDLAGMTEKAIVDYAFRIMDTPPEDLFEVT